MEPPKRQEPRKPARSPIRGGTIVAVTAGIMAGVTALGIKRAAIEKAYPDTWETPQMVAAARARNFTTYDRGAFERHPYLRKVGPTVLKHWDRLTEIAGNDFNLFAVADTLSRAPRSVRDLGTEITEQGNAARNSFSPDERARAARKELIFRRVLDLSRKDPGVEQMLQDMYGLPSRPIEEGREVFYGGSWERGKLRSGAQNRPTPTPTGRPPTPTGQQRMRTKSVQPPTFSPRRQ